MNRGAHIIALSLCLVLLLGCNAYNNFRAYYNTFYNAKKSFGAGVASVRSQPLQIDAGQFISIYPTYPAGGGLYFSEAVDDAGQILRRFSKSKWVNNALLLIGKSYFFQHKYYPALQKFEAVLNLPKEKLTYEAVLWKARVFFKMKQYRAGSRFIQKQIREMGAKWTISQKAVVMAHLAAHWAQRGKIEAAVDTLQKYVVYMEDSNLAGRTYFLLGQLFLRAKKYNKAYQAFNMVERYNPEYVLVYYARLKSAKAAVMAGQLQLARILYNRMLMDDKNRQHYAQITYRLGKTVEQENDFQKAKQLYKRALQHSQNRKLSAKIYYSLARLLSSHFKNYLLAAAYYDSAKAKTLKREHIIGNNKRAYGRYMTLKAKINRIDSLLWLAGLAPAALDSVLSTVDRRKAEKVQQKSLLTNQRFNADEPKFEEQKTKLAGKAETIFGFLNYQNEALVARGIRQFKSIWGNRPLVDNWRRLEAVRKVTAENYDGHTNEAAQAAERTASQLRFVEKIPATPRQKKAKRERRLFLQYQLANLFYLTLNKPDSAAFYYKKVYRKSESRELAAKALYALYNVYKDEGRLSKTAHFKQIILRKYPNSIYAHRLSGGSSSRSGGKDRLSQKVHQIVNSSLLTSLQKAKKLEQLALQHQASGMAANIYYRSIQRYIKAAKAQPLAGSDTSEMNGTEELKYTGPHWQKVREMLARFHAMFPRSGHNSQVRIWQQMLNDKLNNR